MRLGVSRVGGRTITPPHPTPRSAPRPALAARALPGTRASGAHAVPYRPGGRGAGPRGLVGP
ncbi:hypothetical protein XacyCFBP2565_18985 [Xanthomonas arboricola pv. corylina]|nr:hypothetical protein XacyCFBP2565_18985 [Xanthomonas arboricola pv. corylina]